MNKTLVLAMLCAAAGAAAKPAEESQRWVQCMKKHEYYTKLHIDSLAKTSHCHYFGERCNREWAQEEVYGQFPSYDVGAGGVIVNRSARLMWQAMNQGELCMKIMDEEGLE